MFPAQPALIDVSLFLRLSRVEKYARHLGLIRRPGYGEANLLTRRNSEFPGLTVWKRKWGVEHNADLGHYDDLFAGKVKLLDSFSEDDLALASGIYLGMGTRRIQSTLMDRSMKKDAR